MKDPVAPQFSEAQYLAFEEAGSEKYELHHGFLVAFAGGTIGHDALAFEMRKLLERIYPAPCRTIGSDVKLRIAEDLFYYADAGVICEPIDETETIVERPRVVVEVLSPKTARYDIVEKRAAYRTLPSLEAYVIVHTSLRRIEIDTRGLAGRWQTGIYEEEDVALLGGHEFAVAAFYGRYVDL